MTASIAGLTIGGKGLGKKLRFKRSRKQLFLKTGQFMAFFKKETFLVPLSVCSKKGEIKVFLDEITEPAQLKNLSLGQLEELANSIREKLITTVSKTGGHLAPNLGVVELTLALHKVFNSPVDKIIWDVGHQSYVHKMLTGRLAELPTLRQYGGLSGFPKTSESPHALFNTGHSSTSISAALEWQLLGIYEAKITM